MMEDAPNLDEIWEINKMFNELIGKLREIVNCYYGEICSHVETIEKAADTIELLRKKIEENKTGGWIPCSEKYPEWGTKSYLVCLKNGGIFLALYLSSGEFKEISSMGTREFCENNPVIAWMPLPEPFEVEENG